MSFRITDVDCIGRAKTPQLNLPGVVWWPNVYIYIYIYIYILWHPSCARRRPGTVTAVPSYGPHWRGCRPGPLHAGTFTRVPGGVFVGHRPPRDPSGPLQIIEVLHLFRWYTHTKKSRKQWFPSKKYNKWSQRSLSVWYSFEEMWYAQDPLLLLSGLGASTEVKPWRLKLRQLLFLLLKFYDCC